MFEANRRLGQSRFKRVWRTELAEFAAYGEHTSALRSEARSARIERGGGEWP